MQRKEAWTKWVRDVPYGKKLVRLHSWNAWLILILAITGILLFVEPVRELGEIRVWLKGAHIWLGVLSAVLIALYLPLFGKHWKALAKKRVQRWNLGAVLFLLMGWTVTGVLLWAVRSLPPVWGNGALLLHDLFTWVGIPYAIYHSVSRSRWVKAARAKELPGRGEPRYDSTKADAARTNIGAGAGASAGAKTVSRRLVEVLQEAPISRSTFLRLAAGLLLVIGVGPSFYRWLKQSVDSGGAALDELASGDANRMLPPPNPLPESNPPIGGGAEGQFRVYTVTDIPAFASETWKFEISGLVEREQQWDWAAFNELKRTVQVSNFHCITGWSVYHVTWEGIPLKELLKLAGVKEVGRFVKFYSGDGVYTDCLSLDQAGMDDMMVAVLMDGKPIPQQLGGPVRLITPQMYAYKSVKWLQAIELIDQEHIGYWELRGYDKDAWVKGSRLS